MAPDEPASSASGMSVVHKAIAGVFVTVCAPVLVAFGIKFSDTLLTAKPQTDKAATTAPAAAPATTAAPAAAAPSAGNPASGTPATQPAAAAAANPPPTVPNPPVADTGSSTSSKSKSPKTGVGTSENDEVHLPHFKRPLSPVTRLFNGRDLTGFYTYLGPAQPKGKPQGKDYDPEKVFSVKDGQLIVSGQALGVLETVKDYSDYWLTLEYKWGERTWPPRAEGARHSAVLLNIDGPDGVVRGTLPASIHCQIIEGSTGDFLLATGHGEHNLSLTIATEEREVGHGPKGHLAFFYKPGQPFTTFTDGFVKRYPSATGWQDVKGFHAPNDIERPQGEWNTLEIVTLEGKIMVQLNDQVVNFAKQVSPAKGRIGIQSNGAEIIFRTINLQPYHRGKRIQEKP